MNGTISRHARSTPRDEKIPRKYAYIHSFSSNSSSYAGRPNPPRRSSICHSLLENLSTKLRTKRAGWSGPIQSSSAGGIR
jgi:hypothetical protein